MNFKIGQKVSIKRNLGQRNGRAKETYYHGGNLRGVPLGAKAVVDELIDQKKLHLKFENERYGNNSGWYVHPEELTRTEDQIKAEEEQREKFDSLLEDVLSDEPSISEKEEPSTERKEFKPKFNAREEFAIWVRQEFPNIDDISERKEEVLKGARMAYDHAMRTIDGGCIQISFKDRYNSLNYNNEDLAYNLNNFVKLIEKVSSNLRSRE